MRFHTLLTLALLSSAAFAAQLPEIPKESIAKKGELLFSDDFNGTTHDAKWHRVVDTFTFENGVLKGTQTRDQDVPAQDGKPAVTKHAAVYGLELPTKDSVVEVKIRFEGNTLMDVEFDDRKFTGSHYGHLCRAQVLLDQVKILDERDGTQSNQLIELRKDPVKNKEEIGKLLSTHTISFPLAHKLEQGKWYTLVVETVGEQMRVTIDGTPVAYFKSPGIGHETKSKIELGVSGKSGLFDDIKVWNASPAK
ncbi:hypothetical protein CfE428DRAFT_3735 [Chthoniobacter flavus Ellin428]|uniref:3-keto-disaccharide hydrolase domain-containing protein n=1 Tax=Chthoniobacter flavus Ellin428 TaxID=497964 RepID=B4D497_9BACT|nr:hypothetical protein [Chthoniobacter flavus]EDY18698.1 hypothetical protein CfE428DRAFT_3735 [Chthoniobacter flavus Ellin428]TCO89063.1 hypothetical protein EV701_11598 [Chthoniobacter flavus]